MKANKKILAFIMALSCAISSVVISADSIEEIDNYGTDFIKTGDINADGEIDLTDLSELSLAIIGDKTLTESQFKAADINENGEADLTDLARLKQYVSKVVTSLQSAISENSTNDKSIPHIEEIVNYSYDELHDLTSSLDEETLIKAWGTPDIVNNQRIWTIPYNDGYKFVTAWIKNGLVQSLDVSFDLYVTVADIEDTMIYGIVDYNDYSMNTGMLTILPDTDCFGNKINYSAGDLYCFQFDGMIMESYPAQINKPYSAILTGHLSDDETSDLKGKIKLTIF